MSGMSLQRRNRRNRCAPPHRTARCSPRQTTAIPRSVRRRAPAPSKIGAVRGPGRRRDTSVIEPPVRPRQRRRTAPPPSIVRRDSHPRLRRGLPRSMRQLRPSKGRPTMRPPRHSERPSTHRRAKLLRWPRHAKRHGLRRSLKPCATNLRRPEKQGRRSQPGKRRPWLLRGPSPTRSRGQPPCTLPLRPPMRRHIRRGLHILQRQHTPQQKHRSTKTTTDRKRNKEAGRQPPRLLAFAGHFRGSRNFFGASSLPALPYGGEIRWNAR